MLENFFLLGTPLNGTETGTYIPFLVALSYLVASLASYVALDFASHLRRQELVVYKNIIMWGGAFALGAGIWSMHFVGMLAFHMDMAMNYDPLITIFSLVIAVIVAYFVLDIIKTRKITVINIGGSAVLLGLGICAMHYTGMAAMEMDATLLYTPWIFALSVLIAIAASGAALMIAFNIPINTKYEMSYKLVAASIMGVAICGMHYTGMEAAVFIPFANCRYAPDQTFDLMAFSITAVTSLILGGALAFSAYVGQQKSTKDISYKEAFPTKLVYTSLISSFLVLTFVTFNALDLKTDLERSILDLKNHLLSENAIHNMSEQVSAIFYFLIPSIIFLLLCWYFSLRSLRIWRREIERLALFPENDPMPIVEIGEDNRICYANQSALKIFPTIEKDVSHPLLKNALLIIYEKMETENLDISQSEVQIEGKTYDLKLLKMDIKGKKTYLVYCNDVTAYKTHEKSLSDYAKILLRAKEDPGFITKQHIALMQSPVNPVEQQADERKLYSGKRILVVEDIKINQMLITKVLEKHDLEVEIADNGKIAVDMIHQNTYDLVFMDCQMPEMDGFEATQEIRKYELKKKENRTPIVALTADALVGDREKCLSVGMDDYLNKPLRFEQVASTLEKWLNKAGVQKNIA